MAGMCSLLLVALNVITGLVGIAIAGLGAWLATKDPSSCLQFLNRPILALGCCLAIVSTIALCAAFFKVSLLLRLYLLLLVVLVCGFLILVLITFLCTHKSAAKAVSSLGYKQYRIPNVYDWFENQIYDPTHWLEIRACLEDSKMCFYDYVSNLAHLSKVVHYLADDIYNGCCIPPQVCGFTENGAMYSNATNSGADADCNTYDNDETIRCFDCTSCPAGVLKSVRNNWKKIGIGDAAIAAILLLLYVLASQAF